MQVVHNTPEPGLPQRSPTDTSLLRRRLTVLGRVQGVGFRPFVYRLATQQRLAGVVGNDSHGAFIEIEGPAPALDAFMSAFPLELPPLAHISELVVEPLTVRHETHFYIETSNRGSGQDAEIAPDVAVCDACLAELFDPADRRYGYPFINCMNCGPRYSIIRGVPYDRGSTTMAKFTMCPACQAEYEDPAHRRFHAQPNACPACGPKLWLVDSLAEETEGNAIQVAARWLMSGRIVAIKGIGGFHLACRADDGAVVQRLRERKQRDAKALAVMVPSLELARELAELDDASAAALSSVARPIVLASKRDSTRLCGEIAPGSDYYGLMLPYAPVHHLLFAQGVGPLVMTSANPSEEPMCCDNNEAIFRLHGIADAFLIHDRDIERRVDDSVVLAIRAAGLSPARPQRNAVAATTSFARMLPIRRARGYAPEPITVPHEALEPVLAVGGELKSTVCLLAGRQAVMSEHLGELSNVVAFRNFAQTIERFKELLRLDPRIVACDLHPDYAATRHALRLGLRVVEVQHHHAHVVSCMADNGLSGSVLGLSCDGTGYGTDAAIWGCELFACDEVDFTRAAHLDYFPLLGGDAAAIETWRPAAGLLHQAYGEAWSQVGAAQFQSVEPEAIRMAAARLRHATEASRPGEPNAKGSSSAPMTSSLGRLFDAAAFLLGFCDRNRHEAEAAMTLEAIARRQAAVGSLPFAIEENGTLPMRMDVRALVREMLDRLKQGEKPERLARAFHETVAEMLAAATRRMAAQTGLDRVVLSGGCFANRLLLELLTSHLQEAGLAVFVHDRVPTGDGGIALGQAVVAAERLRRNQ